MAAGRTLTRLRHMLEAARAIARCTAGKTYDEFAGDPDLCAAVERYLERLSEASRHPPEDLKTGHAEIDWRGVADIGNVLRHAYDQVSGQRLWQVVTADLAPLTLAVEQMIAEIERQKRE